LKKYYLNSCLIKDIFYLCGVINNLNIYIMFYIDIYGGRPVSGTISTQEEYEASLGQFPDFCGHWEGYETFEEAEEALYYMLHYEDM
jgi:hypothetical protein